MFSTPETSVHVLDKNREISPLERERGGRLREKGSGEKVSFRSRMEDPMIHGESPTTDLGAESEPGDGGEHSEVAD